MYKARKMYVCGLLAWLGDDDDDDDDDTNRSAFILSNTHAHLKDPLPDPFASRSIFSMPLAPTPPPRYTCINMWGVSHGDDQNGLSRVEWNIIELNQF